MDHASNDFGNIYHHLPSAVLYPKSVSDISSTIKQIFDMGPTSDLTVAARGKCHSLQGQGQASPSMGGHQHGIIQTRNVLHKGELPYVDFSGGELWKNILYESLKHGLAPKSWTYYLHLTVGGTLSNAGIRQAFRHGLQTNNVYRLEVVTGMGELITYSESQDADLFYGILGGLG